MLSFEFGIVTLIAKHFEAFLKGLQEYIRSKKMYKEGRAST